MQADAARTPRTQAKRQGQRDAEIYGRRRRTDAYFPSQSSGFFLAPAVAKFPAVGRCWVTFHI